MATIATGESRARAMLALKEKEARTMLERVRAHAAARPYQTMGAAALAVSMVLPSAENCASRTGP